MEEITEDPVNEIDEQASNEPQEVDEQAAAPEHEDEGEGEVTITIGDEQPEQREEETRAPEWVRDLRKQNREHVRELRALKEENERLKGGTQQRQTVVVGPKPTLAACEYDEEKYDAALEAWYATKRKADDQAAEVQRAEQQARQAWQSKLEAYESAKSKLRVRDFDDAEAAVQDSLTTVQQGIILNGAENPAVLVYALGRAPAKAKELAAITDPVKFAFAVAKLETTLKVSPSTRTAPPPESRPRGSSAPVSGGDSTLDRLRKEADKTGDRSKVAAYLRQQRSK